MSIRRRTVLGLAVVLLLAGHSSEPTRAFALLPQKWNFGVVTMHLQLGTGPALLDGSSSFDAALIGAIDTWNSQIDFVKLLPVADSTVRRGDGDLINHVFFDSTHYGQRFGPDELAVTTRWFRNGSPSERVEADIVFNTAFQWNSYRGGIRSIGGRETWDIVRVGLHELGHVLGLDHPDDHGQRVEALMNSIIRNSGDSLTADDIAGARSMYNTGNITAPTVSFPPRNEPNDFYAQLNALYRDRLGAAPVTTFIDPEGAVVWLSEYARYRVGLCDHRTAQARVFWTIDSGTTMGVCERTPAGAIPFPPRNEGLEFMTALNQKYRDSFARSPVTSSVDNEGAVVWVLEYFRYRLNGCTHGDAVTRVFQQILGQGIQPVCRA
jgi:hypothetical protein